MESGKGPLDLLSACMVLCGGILDDSGGGTSDPPPDGEDAAVMIEACCKHADATESDFDFFLFISKTDT